MVFKDLKKAYYKTDWNAMLQALQVYGVGSKSDNEGWSIAQMCDVTKTI